MEQYRRNERIGAIMYILTSRPNEIFTYNYFSEMFNVKKPSISGDISIMKGIVKKLDIGKIETISGASGGVKFLPKSRKDETKELLENLCKKLSHSKRIIPGGFIYTMDILYTPSIIRNIGKIFANEFIHKEIDYVVTVETKGIPIALMTADILNVPLIVIRKNIKITEGPTVNINYVSGSTRAIQTMSLSKKAIRENSKVLIIDDFMKAGGTVKGINEMMYEFGAQVVGVGIFLSTKNPEKKLVKDYTSLIELEGIDEQNGKIYLNSKFESLGQF
ncbi:pur operon repressor [Anaerosalibacter massiliensis]|uniref:Pur operon repressor n=1 Tax=Anaerosalibacter massiliensis TaxID=1347392 RepID=A0A9X2MHZ9_9FIRM|nr:pur operon repressor [Anaerosalibacter massiliensis]MCR2043886.1 pur operon repressor [Anaerosalibacter massiliensis]